ncbi:MAG: hypothetical protein WEB00_10935 [Dehalococcoidia bacterium]
MKPLAILLALLAALALALPARADDAEVVSARLDGAEDLTVGDRFSLTVEVRHDPGTSIAVLTTSLLGNVDVVSVGRPATRQDGDRQLTTLRFELAAFVVGDLIVGPLVLQVIDGAGEPIEQLNIDAGNVEIFTTLGAGQEVLQLRDIEGQFAPPEAAASRARPFLYGLGALAAVVALGGAAYLYLRRRVRPGVSGPTLTPEEEAAAELDALGVDGLLAGNVIANYARLSRVVRAYISACYGFPAVSYSTREVEREMVRRGLDRWQARLVSGLLGGCDDVVYGGFRPAPARAETDLNLAYQILELEPARQPTLATAPAGGGR